MEIASIVAVIADQADDILRGVASRREARATIGEHLSSNYQRLSEADRLKVINGVMGILEEEDFFAAGKNGDQWAEGDDGEGDDN